MPKAQPGSEVVMPMRGLRQQELSRRWRTMLADGGSFGRREQACAWCSRPANRLQSYFSHHPSTAAMGGSGPRPFAPKRTFRLRSNRAVEAGLGRILNWSLFALAAAASDPLAIDGTNGLSELASPWHSPH
jgi:hypothetical protein